MTTAVIREYGELDATALADLVRRGDVSSSELVNEAIRRLEQVNSELNAVVFTMYEHARASAATINRSRRFPGVPFLMKDFAAEMAGFPLREGSRFLEHYVPKQDSAIVRRFAEAGLITFGKTNLPEFAIGVTTEPQWMGATHTRGICRARLADHAADRRLRSPPVWYLLPTATMLVDRSAFPHRLAAWLDLSRRAGVPVRHRTTAIYWPDSSSNMSSLAVSGIALDC